MSTALLGILLAVAASIGGLLIVAAVLVRLPAEYFLKSCDHSWPTDTSRAARLIRLIVMNAAGLLLLALGIVMLVVPGPGIMTILLGTMLMSFPGKRRIERWLAGRPGVLPRVNALRAKFGRTPMHLDA